MRRRLRTAVALVALSGAASAQTAPTWETLGGYPEWADPNFGSVLLIPRDDVGEEVFAVGGAGVLRYAPGEENGQWEDWQRRCYTACSPVFGIRTAHGSLLIGAPAGPSRLDRSTDDALTWDTNLVPFGTSAFFQSTLPTLGGAIFLGEGGDAWRSLADGARGSWVQMGQTGGDEVAFAEVPSSAALPNGRLLAALYNGISYSDDGAATFRASSAYCFACYVGTSFAFRPEAGHPYGGAVFAGLMQLGTPQQAEGILMRSDDGGRTWALVHRFDPAAWGLTVVREVTLLATSDGTLWAGLNDNGAGPAPHPGTVVRSTDGGVTWERVDTGFGRWRVHQLTLSRTGVLYAATDRGIWRTMAPVVAVAGEAGPAEAPGVGVAVRPNPASGRAEVALTLAEAGPVRVVVLDALGREAAVVLDGAAPAGERVVGVDVSGWPAGVYVVRATAGAHTATARLVVAR